MKTFLLTFLTSILISTASAQEENRIEAEPYYQKGWRCLYNENLDSAHIYFNKCIEIDPNNYWYDQYIAKTITRKGNADNAINQWILIEHTLKSWYSQEATDLDHLLFEEALVRYLEKDTSNAEILIQKDLVNHPGTRGWQLGQLAYFNLVYNNPKQALIYYTEALSFKNNINYSRNIAKAKFLTGHHTEGLSEMDKIIRDNPKNYINFLYRAEMHISLNNPNKAIADLEKSIDIQKTEKAFLILANLYLDQDKKEDAYNTWTIAKKIFKSKEAKTLLKLNCKKKKTKAHE